MPTPYGYDNWTVEELSREEEALQWRIADLAADAELEPDEQEAFDTSIEILADNLIEVKTILKRRRNHYQNGRGPKIGKPAMTDVFKVIRDKLTLEDFLTHHGTVLAKRGRDLWGLCPLPDHNERTPSFKVSPDRQQWYCFGCNRGGDMFHLAMFYYQEPSTVEAARTLAGVFGIDLTPPKPERKTVSWPKPKAAVS